jgi:hypothetical protein
MPLVPIDNLGQIGIIKDTPPYALPPNAWSGGNNVRFLDGGVKKCAGYAEVFATCPFAPYYVVPYKAGTNYYWLAFGLEAIAVYTGGAWVDLTRQSTGDLNGAINNSVTTITLTDASDFPTSGKVILGSKAIADGVLDGYEQVEYSGKSGNDLTGCTRGQDGDSGATDPAPHSDGAIVTPIGTTATTDNPYQATANENWSVTKLGGLLVATNGYDPAQMWPLNSSGVPQTTVPFRELQNWQSADATTSTYYCKSISAFRTFLVGLNWSKVSVDYPRLVKWSTEAASFHAPVSWLETDYTLDAGEYELTETAGDILDGRPLGDSFIIYKEDSTYIMNYVGTPYIFSFKTLSPTIGIITKNSVKEFEGGHFFIGNSDCYVNNGQQINPLLPKRLRREMFDNINGDEYYKCFVAADYIKNEMMACYPSGSSTFCDKALIWNWKDDTLAIRDIPNLAHINSGIAEITVGTKWGAQAVLNEAAMTTSSPATGGNLTVVTTTATPSFTATGSLLLQGKAGVNANEVITYTGVTGTQFTNITRATTPYAHDNSIKVNQLNTLWDAQSGAWGTKNYEGVLQNLVFAEPGIKATISGATQANPVVITSTTHGLADGDKITIEKVVGMVQLNGNVYYAKRTGYTGTTFALYSDVTLASSVNGSGYTAYSSGGFVEKPKLYRDDAGNKNDTTDMVASIERTGYDLGDPSTVKYVRAVWPKVEVSGTSNTINIYVGSQMSTEDGVDWGTAIAFNPNTQSKVSCRVSGKFFAVKFESTGDFDWRLHGVDFEAEPRGNRGSRSM